MQRLALILICLISISLSAQIRKYLLELDSMYQKGKTDEVADRIAKVKAKNDEERALLSYYGASLKKDITTALSLYERAGEQYSKTYYGQLSILEAAKIHVLERDYSKAQLLLRKISSPQIPQRMYWLAVVAFAMDDFDSAIAQAENYLRLSPNGKQAENTMHLITDAYIAQKKYHSAILYLDKITKLEDYDRQYYLYRLGYCYELSGKTNDALSSYRNAYEVDKYSQIAYLVEERLFGLRAQRPSLDLSFLYPYNPVEIPEIDTLETPAVQDSSATPAFTMDYDSRLPLKLLAKPQIGFYLQSGRFSVESNARRLSESIRKMRMPAVYYEEDHNGKTTWVVLAGPFDNQDQCALAKDTLKNQEINCFIVQY